MPKKVKHRKWQRGRMPVVAKGGSELSFGTYGLKAMDSSYITSRQIEAARRAMTRFVQRGGKIWIRIFPDRPITNHGNEMRMGKGKGAVDHFVAVVGQGRMIFEIDGVDETTAVEAMRLAAHKLPLKTRFVRSN